MYLSGEVLVESRFARDRQIAEIPSEQAQEVLNRAEALIFSVWRSPGESQQKLFREASLSKRCPALQSSCPLPPKRDRISGEVAFKEIAQYFYLTSK
jgi:hypothetical protein